MTGPGTFNKPITNPISSQPATNPMTGPATYNKPQASYQPTAQPSAKPTTDNNDNGGYNPTNMGGGRRRRDGETDNNTGSMLSNPSQSTLNANRFGNAQATDPFAKYDTYKSKQPTLTSNITDQAAENKPKPRGLDDLLNRKPTTDSKPSFLEQLK
eukprot:CAMPEP_0176390892 /NCGR_PEP_ID=MMETSP0126-20121128/39571_1 /TAXON_ID=141414 ORGANISM="Strombidinopsis acuminatum, Strain SPMC142" /NCGR_SAMPLE_ID=MMETSP0126 /ASSEMBLY_ACC=CAM_ASM_000229 /LENGTH=155 /DNA_ID=CAMNT_0017760641 /DNA_START=400 /DNA_END=867 /DNA_ORIENTATION=-